MVEGRDYHCLVDKRRDSIRLRITDVQSGERLADHAWDLTDETILKDRDPRSVDQGRIGIRLMGGHRILMRDFRVERLQGP